MSIRKPTVEGVLNRIRTEWTFEGVCAVFIEVVALVGAARVFLFLDAIPLQEASDTVRVGMAVSMLILLTWVVLIVPRWFREKRDRKRRGERE